MRGGKAKALMIRVNAAAQPGAGSSAFPVSRHSCRFVWRGKTPWLPPKHSTDGAA
jgi:hypothetical protein